ncbi:hypothetical protein BO94DRAFT_455824 [Aspergillus sclerotioniger CBS 115572]|uniref:Uncharacterized protein n=1 Tax=Aspergillus sclerotioniger CBS 115572 TaxID=1450535 RepID=A0A317XFZ1_9EURO|nr:hypothetical protein BO94DRAFT_455824 [Aspergillus sclerotioniger CBS 115572]PWY95730.1 hypothetical protein BO94DRAFT_455824 [Aspergillus sclerotioniger CBS 115572]
MAADPAPKTFRILMRHHRDLFVNPLFWTSHHLDLLGCQFEDIEASSIETTLDDSGSNNDRSLSNVESLATNLFMDVKHRCLVRILVGEGRAFAKTRKGSPFFFAGQPVHRPHYTVFHRHGQPTELTPSHSPPLIGYLHYTNVTGARLDQFEPRPDPSGRLNLIGASIRNKRAAQITPTEWAEDPYFLCSRLLVTHALEEEYIHLYEIEISARMLAILRDSNNATEGVNWPNIRHERIPFKPYTIFTGRIVTELVAPNLSPPDDLNGVVRHGAKRGCEQENREKNKTRRVS